MTDEKAEYPQAVPENAPVQLAVFDFDGTSISGDSPVILVRYLVRHKMIKFSTIIKILLWAFAYKARLPQNESWVRGLVFSAFDGMPQAEADAFLRKFYDEKISSRFRKEADEVMRRHHEEGHVVLVVSATFEPIILRAMEQHSFCHQLSTRMHVDDQGRYTCKVEGLPVQGEQKIAAIEQYANETYGEGGWELAFAYGDHHSDRPLLTLAKHAYAVTPDIPLERTAKREQWEILDWE